MRENFIKVYSNSFRAIAIGAVIALLVLLASLPAIGPSASLAAGLAAGLMSGSLCVFFIDFFLTLSVGKRKSGYSLVGFCLRIVIFGSVFYASLKYGGYEGGAGCALAFLAPYAGAVCAPSLQKLYYRISGKSPAVISEYIYEENLHSGYGSPHCVFVKNHDTVKYLHGRKFITHKSFRRLREIREVPADA